MQSVIPARHLLLALAVVFVWGTNFVVIKLGLNALGRCSKHCPRGL